MRLTIPGLLLIIVKSLFIKACGNRFAQDLLEKNVLASQYLLGIGSGAWTASSGEQAIFAVLKQRAKPPYRIFDVGANTGQFLRLAVANVAPHELEIHCFEPGQEAFKGLVAASSADARLKLNNIGMGRERSEAVLHYDRPGSGLASLTRRKLDHFGIDFSQAEKVRVDTIDNYCAENAIGRIHLLKLDIEGHELDALAGASRMLAAKAIDLVSFEFGGCNIDTRTFFRDFWYLLAERDFSIFRVTPSGYLRPVESYTEVHEQFRTTNFVAVTRTPAER